MTEESPPRVLVIDDEEAIADLYAEWLTADYEVETAYSGREAMAALDASIDVILLDRRMPGQPGDSVLAEVRERGIDTRVAMVTAVSPDFDVVEMGFDDYLVKPVTGEELLETVARLLRLTDYDEELQTYYSLVTKKAILEAERPRQLLESSDEYASLCAEVDEARARLDELGSSLEAADFDSLLRGIDSEEEGFSATT